MDFEVQKNPNTGAEERVAQATGKLISISDSPKENKNGTPFRNATVELPTVDGSRKQFNAIVYEKNYGYGMAVGNSYLCRIVAGADGVLITMSHLSSADSATLADFGLEASTTGAKLDA